MYIARIDGVFDEYFYDKYIKITTVKYKNKFILQQI